MAKQALVTGSQGFVGRHLIKSLDARGFRVLEVDIVQNNDAIKFFQRNTDRFDLVAHCAYVVGGRATIDGRNTALIENELLDASLFDWALRTRQKAVLYFSSSAAYPVELQTSDPFKRMEYAKSKKVDVHFDINNLRLKEEDIDFSNLSQPDANYGWAKLNGERLARVAGENGLRVHVVRPFSGYGSDQSLDYPFPSIIRRAIAGELEVWGPPGQTRDWIHIDDVVEASLQIYEADERRPVNLCTGRGVEMGELMIMARTAYTGDSTMAVNYLEDKPTGVFYRVGDPTLMNAYYKPTVSIEAGVSQAIAKYTD